MMPDWKSALLDDPQKMLEAVLAVASREEAQEFMRAYREATGCEGTEIGYLAGYCDQADAERIWDWFGVRHPVFGCRYPSPGESIGAGIQIGKTEEEGDNGIHD